MNIAWRHTKRPGARALMFASLLLLAGASVVRAEKPELEISAFELDTLPLKPPSGAEFTKFLNAEGSAIWGQAKPMETKGAWNELPRGANRDHWVSIVTTGFNEQADAYAFMFNGPDGAMSMAAHLPFRQTWMEGGYLAWIWPSRGMLDTLRIHHEALKSPAKRLPLALRVVPWEGAETETVATKVSASAKTSTLDEARTLDPEQVFSPVAVMAHAAAFEAGWAPTPGKAPHSATLEVRVEDSSCSFRLKFTGPPGEELFVKEHVPWETYHDHLARVFQFAQRRNAVRDFTQLFRGGIDLLCVEDGRLVCLLNKELTAFDLSSGHKLWTTEPAVKGPSYRASDQYASLARPSGENWLLQYGPQLSQIGGAKGAPASLAPVKADSPRRIATDGEHWAGIAGGALQVAARNQLAWEHKQLNPLTAGPTIAEGLVFSADATGKLVARAVADGAVRWEATLPGQLYGTIVPDRDQVYAFSNETESLIALDMKTGQQRWARPVGDVLKQAPLVLGTQLLVATKGNRLLLVDRAKGAELKSTAWPTWLVSLCVAPEASPPLVGCTDLSGDVTFISLETLLPVRKVSLGRELVGSILYVDRMPLRWPVVKPKAKASDDEDDNLLSEIKSGPVPMGPAWLVTDQTGFLYILPHAIKE